MDSIRNAAMKEKMLERDEISLNGHTFSVEPIFMGEEKKFANDFPYKVMLNGEVTTTQKSEQMTRLFTNSTYKEAYKPKLHEILLKKLHKRWYYSDLMIWGLIKWLQKKVYYNEKNIDFYDLERKFGLKKSEIYSLVEHLYDISFFQ